MADTTKLEAARRLLSLSQHELDREAGLPKGSVHDLEAGRIERPSFDTVVKITRALRRRGLIGINAEELFHVPDGDGKAIA